MNLLENKLRELEKENKETYKTIKSSDNRNLLREMMKYIAGSAVSPFQVQVIYKDFLGMALEAEQEGIILKEKLGVEPKEFCDDVIENVGENRRYEQFLKVLVYVIQALAIHLTVIFFFNGENPENYKFYPVSVVVIWVGMSICVWIEGIVKKKMLLRENRVFEVFPAFVYILFWAVLFFTTWKYPEMYQYPMINVNGVVLMLIVDGIAILMSLLWNYYWEVRVKEYL